MNEEKPFYIYLQLEDLNLKFIGVYYALNRKNAIKKALPMIKHKIEKGFVYFCFESMTVTNPIRRKDIE